MLTLLGLALAIWILGGVLRLPRQARWLMIALLYVLVLAALVLLPEGHPMRAALGAPIANWLVIGGVAVLAWGYGNLLSRLRRRAAHGKGVGPDPQAEGQSGPAGGIGDTAGWRPGKGPGDGDGAGRPPAPRSVERYSRHILLREIGGPGQKRLAEADLLVVGAGGIGAPALLYLVAAGVGRITLVDDDRIALSNLQRQVIFATEDVGKAKVSAAADRLGRLNPDVQVAPLEARLDAALASRLIPGRTLVLDGSDSFATRAVVNAACVAAGVPLLSAAVTQWEGQITLYDPARGAPCFACLFPTEPAPGLAPACAEAGVAGPVPGVLGTMAALEAVKEITGAGTSLRGRLLLFDGLHGETRTLSLRRDPRCPVCGSRAA